METAQLSVHVLKCPFGVRNLHFMQGVDTTASSVSVLDVGDHYALVESDTDPSGAALRSNLHYAVAGTRGIQQLVASTRGASGAVEGASGSKAATVPSADLFSMHDKGRLLLWDSYSGSLAAAHAFNPAFTVHQCVVTAVCVYTTLEGSPATAGAEEETCVYAWDRRTLQPITVLRGHEGRLTALAVAPVNAEGKAPTNSTSPATAEVVLASASLDGTVRLWRHRHDAAAAASHSGAANDKTQANPIQTLAVLPAAELGVIHGLHFLSPDVLVAACSRCALAFVRLSSLTSKQNGANSVPGGRSPSVGGDGVRWQQVRSTVDPDGSTTALHVCPFNLTDNRKTSSTPLNNNYNNGTSSARPASPLHASRRRKNIVTGSTSGYLQEWVIDLSDADSSPPASPSGGEDAPATTAAPAPVAGVTVRGRWHHKAHAATVDCIVTDEDIAVSTSLFDGARLYHRRAGATCVITTAAVVPVLVPPLKQLVYGGVDGSLRVASYALFATGTEKELQPLWSCKPHAAAIRGVCLSLTSSLQWKALCVGAADGTVSVWQSAPLAAPPLEMAKQSGGKSVAAVALSRVLDVHRTISSSSSSKEGAVTAVGLKKEKNGHALAVATMLPFRSHNSKNNNNNSTCAAVVLPLPASVQPGDVTCARLCTAAKKNAAPHKLLSLLVGTRTGQLLQYAQEAPAGAWRLLGVSSWTASTASRRSSITAISPLRWTAESTALVAVTSQSVVGTSLATQRVLLSILHVRFEHGVLAAVADREGGKAHWEGSVDVPAPAQGSLTSVLSSSSEEPLTAVSWVPPNGSKTANGGAAAEAADYGAATLLVRDSRGMVIRARYGIDGDAPASAAAAQPDASTTWSAPEALMKPAATSAKRAFAGIVPPTDGVRSTEVVVTEGGESDIVCINYTNGRKRVLIKAATRHSDMGGVLCDAGSAAIRLAAVRAGSGAATVGDVSLYDDQGREQCRITRAGAVSSCVAVAPTSGKGRKQELSFSPTLSAASPRSSPARSSTSMSMSTSALAAACTFLSASAADRLLFVGYEDGLLQIVDMTDMFVFVRLWVKDAVGAARAIREVHYRKGVVLVRLADDCLRVFDVPPRSILDQPMPLS